MNTEMQLHRLIICKYGSILKYSKASNIPYSTLASMFKRGVMQISVITFFRLCETLNLDMEAFSTGAIKEKT